MLIKFVGYKIKKQLIGWLPAICVVGIVVNLVCVVLLAFGIVGGLLGYSDGRYPENAVILVKETLPIFAVTLLFYTPFAKKWFDDKKAEYASWKEDWYHDKYNPHA